MHRSKSSCDTSRMLDAKWVGGLLSWTLRPTKKARRYLHGAVEATKANFPFQAWGRKKGGWSDSSGVGVWGGAVRLCWGCGCLQNSLSVCSHHREKLIS